METLLPLQDEAPYSSLEKARDFLREFLCKAENCMGPCGEDLWDDGSGDPAWGGGRLHRGPDSIEVRKDFLRIMGCLATTLSLLQKYPVLASERFDLDTSTEIMFASFATFGKTDSIKGSFFPLTFLIWFKLDTVILKSVCALYPEALYSTQGDYPDMLALACANRNVNACTVVWLLSVFTTDHLTELPGIPPFLSYFAAYMTAWDAGDWDRARHRGAAAMGIDGRVIQAFIQKNPDIAQYSSKEVFAIGWLLKRLSYHDTDQLQLGIPPRLLVSHSDTVFAILEQLHAPRPHLETIIIDGWQHHDMTCLFDPYMVCPHLREDVRDPSQAELEEANDMLLDWLLNMNTNADLDITRFHKLHPEKLNALLDKHAWSNYLIDTQNTSDLFDLPPSVMLVLHSRPELICELTQTCSQGMGSYVSIEGYQSIRESSVQSTYNPFEACSKRKGIEDAGTPLEILVTATTKVLDAIVSGLKARQKPPKTLGMNAFVMLNASLLANISQSFEVLRAKAVGFANEYETPHEKRDGEWDSLCTSLSILPNFRHLAVAATFSKIGAGNHCGKLVELSIERVPGRVANTGTCFNVTDSVVELLTHQTCLRTLVLDGSMLLDGRRLHQGAESFSFDMARVCSALKASVSLEELRLAELSNSMTLLRLTEMLCDALKTSNTTLRSVLFARNFFRDLAISTEAERPRLATEAERPPMCRRLDVRQNARSIQHYLWLNKFGRGHIRDKNINKGQFVQLLIALSEARQSFEAREKILSMNIFFEHVASRRHNTFYKKLLKERDTWCPVLAGDCRTDTVGLLYALLRELPELWCRSTKKLQEARQLKTSW